MPVTASPLGYASNWVHRLNYWIVRQHQRHTSTPIGKHDHSVGTRVPAHAATPLATPPEVTVPNTDNQDGDTCAESVALSSGKNLSGMSLPPPQQESGRWADEIAEESSEAEGPGSTTLMVRNIACRYSREDVVRFLADLGFDCAYDFLYLPLNAMQRANLGYFFINFKTEASSNRCRELLQGNSLGTSQTEKRCDVSLARVQGSKNISKHFHRKAIMRSSHAPIFVGEKEH